MSIEKTYYITTDSFECPIIPVKAKIRYSFTGERAIHISEIYDLEKGEWVQELQYVSKDFCTGKSSVKAGAYYGDKSFCEDIPEALLYSLRRIKSRKSWLEEQTNLMNEAEELLAQLVNRLQSIR